MTTVRDTPTSRKPDEQARVLLESDGDWTERIERAREAREMGRRLREGKSPIANSPRNLR